MNLFEAFHGRVCIKCLAFLCAGLMIVKPDLSVRKQCVRMRLSILSSKVLSGTGVREYHLSSHNLAFL
jgi:hypothetical protein